MPFFYYKTLTLVVVAIQIRRIVCEFCRASFRLLAIGRESARAAGWFSGSMERAVERGIGRKLERRAQRPRIGEAICPHCKRFQSWMVRRSRIRRLGWGLLLGASIGFVVAVTLVFGFGVGAGWEVAALVGITALGTMAGLFLAYRGALQVGPHPDRSDLRSMTEHDVEALAQEAESREEDPAIVWSSRLENAFDYRIQQVVLPPYDP